MRYFFLISCLPFLTVIGLVRCQSKQKPKEILASQQLLGQHLFYEKRISINGTKSCASCHDVTFAFSDGYRRSGTSLGENTLHNAPSLINSSFLHYYDWANPTASSMTKQIKRPLYSSHPVELGLQMHMPSFTAFLKNDSLYYQLFKAAFPEDQAPYTSSRIEDALIAYVSCLISFGSDYDKGKLTTSAENGMKLFNSSRLKCSSCHAGKHFTLAAVSKNVDSVFANIGLYNKNNEDHYPTDDNGLYFYTKKKEDDGKFKIPSLRNVMLTGPYMHDGSVGTIQEVIDIYARGGRNVDYGDDMGDGAVNTYKHKHISGFYITEKEKHDLINFLTSLSDSTIFTNPMFQNPFINK